MRLLITAIGLIMGGAVGNAIDRLAYGAVADFVLLHVETATWRFQLDPISPCFVVLKQ